MRAADNLELLLADAPRDAQALGRKFVTFARLLAADAHHAPATSVRVNLERARSELEEHVRRRLLGALIDLVRHHLYAALGPESFAWLGEPHASPQFAWSLLEEHREDLPWLCAVPEPNESALSVAERLLATGVRLGLSPQQQRLWAARRVRAEFGPERGEAVFRELLAQSLKPDGQRGDARAALAGLVECLLDRGALRSARGVLDDSRELVGDDARTRRLLAWTCLLQDDEAGLRAAEAGQAEWRERVPLALAELRQRRPAWLPYLTGKAPRAVVAESLGASEPAPSRRDFGAYLCAVFAAEPRGGHNLVQLEVAPGLRGRVADWLRDREGACLEPNEPEHRMVVLAREIALHRHGVQILRGTLSPASARAIALAPILDPRGELEGWLRLEFEHHLVPAQSTLARAAQAWRPRVIAHRRERGARPASTTASATPAVGVTRESLALELELPVRSGACAEAFRELVQQLGMKTAQRHWWGFQVRGERAELVAEGGSALGEPAAKKPGGRAVLRALMSAGLVRFDDPAPELALDAGAASGLVLPLVARRRLTGLLAIESSRRKDFSEGHSERLLERCRAFATELRIAQFREWHVAQFGHDVYFSAARSEDAFDDLFASGRSRAPVSIVGPAGSGKQVLARWLHFESDRAGQPLLVFACGSDEGELWERSGVRDSVVARARSGTLLLDDVERMSERGQVRLLELLERTRASDAAPRWVVSSRASLADAVARGALRHDLCQRLQRLQLDLQPLAQRRVEIPPLVALLARRFAAEEGVPAPSFSDEALALLWRQAWPGNLRQLENFIYKVVLLHPGREAAAADLERVAQRFQIELAARLPSRAPDPEVVRAALTTTANLRGSINKTRAALYLGWDPDTLASRMAELGVLEGAPAPAPPTETGPS